MLPHLNKLAIERIIAGSFFSEYYVEPVSYTHLTLPTILRV